MEENQNIRIQKLRLIAMYHRLFELLTIAVREGKLEADIVTKGVAIIPIGARIEDIIPEKGLGSELSEEAKKSLVLTMSYSDIEDDIVISNTKVSPVDPFSRSYKGRKKRY